MAELKQVTVSLVGEIDGRYVELRIGDLFAADDPAVKKWPDHFGSITVRTTAPKVEQATAAPGQKRGR